MTQVTFIGRYVSEFAYGMNTTIKHHEKAFISVYKAYTYLLLSSLKIKHLSNSLGNQQR